MSSFYGSSPFKCCGPNVQHDMVPKLLLGDKSIVKMTALPKRCIRSVPNNFQECCMQMWREHLMAKTIHQFQPDIISKFIVRVFIFCFLLFSSFFGGGGGGGGGGLLIILTVGLGTQRSTHAARCMWKGAVILSFFYAKTIVA